MIQIKGSGRQLKTTFTGAELANLSAGTYIETELDLSFNLTENQKGRNIGIILDSDKDSTTATMTSTAIARVFFEQNGKYASKVDKELLSESLGSNIALLSSNAYDEFYKIKFKMHIDVNENSEK